MKKMNLSFTKDEVNAILLALSSDIKNTEDHRKFKYLVELFNKIENIRAEQEMQLTGIRSVSVANYLP